MKLINTVDAVGHVLCHDMTRIIPGKEKGPLFRKGHVVTEEDIPLLLSIGKEHLYVWEMNDNMLHEDDAAAVLGDICTGGSSSFELTGPKEGKMEIIAAVDGLLKIDRERLNAVNSMGEMMIATVHGDFPVKKGDRLAGTRIIPLVIEKDKMDKAKAIAGAKPILSLLPIRALNYGIITTGSEVYKGLIEDKFGPVLKAKMDEYHCTPTRQIILDDDMEKITKAVLDLSSECDMVLVSGGMSVDPDDRTPGAIRNTGADIVTYGAPVLPGAMFLLAYLEVEGRTVPVMGLPGCVMYARRTVFDLALPRILAGERLTASDISQLGEGGLCLNCADCHFPNCGFGK
ncbi:MAG: molybdopterin-binding protein [Clostridiales bacterium]|nr:molybdopterin-binding protein [Clostridiales bacterium]